VIVDYDINGEFDKMPPHIDKESFFVGISAYQYLLTKAGEEPEHSQGTIVELLHFDVATELDKLLVGKL